jgi:hypothetical protein
MNRDEGFFSRHGRQRFRRMGAGILDGWHSWRKEYHRASGAALKVH